MAGVLDTDADVVRARKLKDGRDMVGALDLDIVRGEATQRTGTVAWLRAEDGGQTVCCPAGLPLNVLHCTIDGLANGAVRVIRHGIGTSGIAVIGRAGEAGAS